MTVPTFSEPILVHTFGKMDMSKPARVLLGETRKNRNGFVTFVHVHQLNIYQSLNPNIVNDKCLVTKDLTKESITEFNKMFYVCFIL